MQNFNWLEALFVFLAATCSDILWVFYIRRTSEGKPYAAAFFSAMIVLLGGLIILAYVGNYLYLILAALGGFVGTMITIKFDIRLDMKNKKRK